ncbi:MAG TPA: class I SAM-dependent methyltransferase [Phycisphaerae bacterium]|nr:class I SAM-dependent methyltransferase [Phycisphaerae bacterium]
MLCPDDAILIRRINQLYHELTHDSFERVHRHRFSIQKPFWEYVARTLPANRRAADYASKSLIVVDLACGTGFVSRTLGSYLAPTDRLIAIDLGEGQLRTTGRNWNSFRESRPQAPALVRLAGDIQTLPLTDESVDLVTINAALHHMPDPMAVLREIDRVLRPGGKFALGFEPNRAHFASPVFSRLARGMDRLCWYANPRQNRRRIRNLVGRLVGSPGRIDATLSFETGAAGRINEKLLREKLIDRPLIASRLLDLIDPHARGEDRHTGFDPGALLGEALPGYRVLMLKTFDYLGETGRFFPAARNLADAALRAIAPDGGSLFCWLLRKPYGETEPGS